MADHCHPDVVTFLEGYRGRDKLIRLLNYGFYIVSGLARRLGKGEFEGKMERLAAEMSNLRVMLRLFDDLAMLRYSRMFGLGASEKDPVIRILSVAKNFLDQCYYPLEHVAWLKDNKILKGNSMKLWIIGDIVWFLSLLLDILISAKHLVNLEIQSRRKSRALEHHSTTESWETEYLAVQRDYRKTQILRYHHQATILGSISDAVNAINWMPEGILWANKLPQEIVGLCGVVSTLCFMYKAVFPVE